MSVPELAIVEISLEVNGIPVERAVVPRTLLVDFLREDLGMTGTKVSCELQVCGVCTVLVDDRPVSACTFLAVDADGARVRTVEGLAEGGAPNRLQEAFITHHALQCGFCTPGFLMMSTALLESAHTSTATTSSSTWRATSAAAPDINRSSTPSPKWPRIGRHA